MFFKLRNIGVLIAFLLIGPSFQGLVVWRECVAHAGSEACTWGYLNVVLALLGGLVFYLLVSIAQLINRRVHSSTEPLGGLGKVLMWALCIPLAGLAAYASLFLPFLMAPNVELPVWFHSLFTPPIFILFASLTAPSRNQAVALLALLLLVVASFDFLNGLTKPDSVTPDYVPMIVSYLGGAATCLVLWFFRARRAL